MRFVDRWHRRSRVYLELIADYEGMLHREYDHHKEIMARIEQRDFDLSLAKAQIQRLTQECIAPEQHMAIVAEAERLKFLCEDQERQIETLKQSVYEAEQELLARNSHLMTDIDPEWANQVFVEPERPKKVMDRLKKLTAKPVVKKTKTTKGKAKVTKVKPAKPRRGV